MKFIIDKRFNESISEEKGFYEKACILSTSSATTLRIFGLVDKNKFQ
jgi:hypothetical protein